ILLPAVQLFPFNSERHVLPSFLFPHILRAIQDLSSAEKRDGTFLSLPQHVQTLLLPQVCRLRAGFHSHMWSAGVRVLRPTSGRSLSGHSASQLCTGSKYLSQVKDIPVFPFLRM